MKSSPEDFAVLYLLLLIGVSLSPSTGFSTCSIAMVVVVLSLTVEWGVGMERQGPSYGEVVSTKDVRVQALLGGSNSPTSRSPEAVEWIMNV